MTTIFVKKQNISTLQGEYQLIYELLKSRFEEKEGEGDYYGIRIRQYGEKDCLIDGCEVPGLTEDLREAEELYDMFVQGNVMPVHLCEMIDDWQSAFHPRMEKLP